MRSRAKKTSVMEPLKRIDCVNCLITRQGSEGNEILLVWNADWRPPTWSLPGGGREPNESLADAAIRETREETGLDVDIGQLVDLHEIIGLGGRIHLMVYTFRCGVRGGAFIHNGASEPQGEGVTEARWFPMEEAKNLDRLKRVFALDLATSWSASGWGGGKRSGASYSWERPPRGRGSHVGDHTVAMSRPP